MAALLARGTAQTRQAGLTIHDSVLLMTTRTSLGLVLYDSPRYSRESLDIHFALCNIYTKI